MTIRIAYNQLEGLINMAKGKSGKKFKKGKINPKNLITERRIYQDG
ncbi:hypothetical protein ES705_17476 [subsurface metagenome]